MRSIVLAASLLLSISCATTAPLTGPLPLCPPGSKLESSDTSTWCETEGGQHVGLQLEWYAPGRLLAVSHIGNGEPVATVLFYETGEVQSVRAFQPDSGLEISRHWYRDGTPKIYAEWADGKLNGLYRTWHANGNPESEGRFLKGEQVGIWKFWGENGELERSAEYGSTDDANSTESPAAFGH